MKYLNDRNVNDNGTNINNIINTSRINVIIIIIINTIIIIIIIIIATIKYQLIKQN